MGKKSRRNNKNKKESRRQNKAADFLYDLCCDEKWAEVRISRVAEYLDHYDCPLPTTAKMQCQADP